ncbi:hypothetical protein [uncultured Halorubrum sp.]|jgi:hypothetical protein|uniref:hypothetical protein n=1 Tax=uncultured Halorubrum sp. TaxID=399555 RepID=UPI0026182A9D|nr:hypothetical protein [uncultured Halorubrum sp.]
MALTGPRDGSNDTADVVTVGDIVLAGVTRVDGSGGWNAPSKTTEEGFEYDSYVDTEPLSASIEAWVDDSELRELKRLRESTEPFPASVDHVSLDLAKLEDLSVEGEGNIRSHRKVTIELAEVREATVGTTEISISTPSGDMGTAANDSSPSVAQPQDDDSGTTDETTNSNGIAEFLGDVQDGLAGLF